MKTTLFKIIAFFVLLYVGSFSNSSVANMTALTQQPLDRSFSFFENNSICLFLTMSYSDKDGFVKPIALRSLPIEYYLHESIPRQYRPFFYVAVDRWNEALRKFAMERWNKVLRDDFIKISSEIDRNPINTKSNRSDRRNVIYLINREFFQEVSTEFNRNQLEDSDFFLPGMSRHSFAPPVSDEPLPFLPLAEVDMMIRQEALTDFEMYKYNLIMSLQDLGVTKPLSDLSVNELRRMVFFHFENMHVEEYRALVIRDMERTRDAISNNSPTMTEHDPQKLNQDIEEVRNMESRRLRFLKYDQILNLLNVDLEMMETQSSITLVNAIMHEIGHGFGLNHIPSNPYKPLMEASIYSEPDQITISKEVDSYALRGMRCLYEDILSY